METAQIGMFVEDYEHNRSAVVKSFSKRNLQNDIKTPASAMECAQAILSEKHEIVLIDYRLTKWVGEYDTDPITLDGVECFNGIQLATWILRNYPKMRIGIYSSFEDDMENILRKSEIYDKVEIVPTKGIPYEHANKNLIEFFQKYLETPVIIKPLHKEQNTPIPLQIYICRKILNAKEQGSKLWKAGNFAWLTAVNSEMQFEDKLEQLPEQWTFGNSETKYAVKHGRNSEVTGIVEEESGIMVSNTDVLDLFFERESNCPYTLNDLGKPIFELYSARVFSDQFLQGEIDWETIERLSRNLSELARFESQKILFKEVQQSPRWQVSSKENIYDILQQFHELGFPNIYEIFIGRVDKIEGDIAYIKLTSCSPEGLVRREEFTKDFLDINFLEENSEFEYTIYQPAIHGIAYHVEPL